MADNYLITGYWGEPHVTAENDRGINGAMFGAGRFVLPVGEQFRAEYIGNNTIRMYDGKLMNNGAAAGIPAGDYVDLLIANSGQGAKRNDLIVFQYEQDASTMIETGKFVVIQGAETSGTASDPALAQSDLLSGTATFDQMALWRIPVSGGTISAPVKLFSVYQNNVSHAADRNNPHGVTASQVGATPASHATDKNNPHGVTAAQVGARPDTWTPGANEVGAIPKTGGTLTGWVKFDGDSIGHEWTTADGTKFHVRPYTPGNVFQIVTYTKDGKTVASLNVGNDGSVNVGNGTALRNNIGAAPTDHTHENQAIYPSAVEIVPASGTDHGGLIDFHYGGSLDDYTARIIEETKGNLVIKGTLGVSDGIHGYVPTSRTINGKPLNVDVSLTPLDIGANPKIQFGSFWADCGSAESGTFSLPGRYMVTNYGNGLFRVLFHGSCQTVPADTFAYGIRRDWLLNNINATLGTSYTVLGHKSSSLDVWRYDNALYAKDGAGFGYCFQERTTSEALYLVPARTHTREGDVGQWPLNAINGHWGADSMVNAEMWLQLG